MKLTECAAKTRALLKSAKRMKKTGQFPRHGLHGWASCCAFVGRNFGSTHSELVFTHVAGSRSSMHALGSKHILLSAFFLVFTNPVFNI